MPDKNKMTNVGIPMAMIKKLDRYIESEKAEELGVHSRRQVIIMLLRQFLSDIEQESVVHNTEYPHLRYVDCYDSGVTIYDKKLDKEIHLHSDHGKSIVCDECKRLCIHLEYYLQITTWIQELKGTETDAFTQKMLKLLDFFPYDGYGPNQ